MFVCRRILAPTEEIGNIYIHNMLVEMGSDEDKEDDHFEGGMQVAAG